jgi:hypothetical protein
MSVKVMSAVWELNLPMNDKFVLLAFADHADDSGFCYPSYARVAWKCGLSERTVARCMAHFKQTGLMEVISDAFRGRTQRCRIHADKGDRLAPFIAEGMPTTTEKAAKFDGKGTRAVAGESSLEPSVNHKNDFYSHPKYGPQRRIRWEREHNGTAFSYERAGVR